MKRFRLTAIRTPNLVQRRTGREAQTMQGLLHSLQIWSLCRQISVICPPIRLCLLPTKALEFKLLLQLTKSLLKRLHTTMRVIDKTLIASFRCQPCNAVILIRAIAPLPEAESLPIFGRYLLLTLITPALISRMKVIDPLTLTTQAQIISPQFFNEQRAICRFEAIQKPQIQCAEIIPAEPVHKLSEGSSRNPYRSLRQFMHRLCWDDF